MTDKLSIKFTEFQSLVNENPKSIYPILRDYGDIECVATEKLHGANFSVYVEYTEEVGNPLVRFASRSQLIGDESVFFHYKRFFTDEFMKSFKSKFLDKEMYPEKGVRFIGELFGGHDAIGIKPVQREIKYSGDIQFRLFHVEFTDRDGTILHANWSTVVDCAKVFGFDLAPVIGYGKLKDLYKINPEEKTALSEDETQIREGICIRSLENLEDFENKPFICKKRSNNFLENKGKITAAKEITLDPKFVEILSQIEALATPQRVSNVNSHFGYDSIKCFPDLHKATMEDFVKDVLKEFNIDLTLKDLKPVYKTIGGKFVQLVRQELLK